MLPVCILIKRIFIGLLVLFNLRSFLVDDEFEDVVQCHIVGKDGVLLLEGD